MKGIALCRAYYNAICLPELERQLPNAIERLAIGLVGEGSECYGFDDELSRDHDFGPRIMIWLTEDDDAQFGGKLRKIVGGFAQSFAGYNGCRQSNWGAGRSGVFLIGDFYAKFTGLHQPPQMLREWLAIPEEFLSTVTNGEVFYDGPGIFSSHRSALTAGYPEDVRLKKIAARCMQAAQAGQYNYLRCLKRGEQVAAYTAGAEFINAAISLVFLLNNRYKPFYKWMHRALASLPLLGADSVLLFNTVAAAPSRTGADAIEHICTLIVGELKRQGLTTMAGNFLLDYGPQVQSRIVDQTLRQSNVWLDK